MTWREPDPFPTTATECDNAKAAEIGYAHPERCWIVTDRDVVHKNPYYVGPPVPHPDDVELIQAALDDENRRKMTKFECCGAYGLPNKNHVCDPPIDWGYE